MAHERVHTGEKPFGKFFLFRTTIATHIGILWEAVLLREHFRFVPLCIRTFLFVLFFCNFKWQFLACQYCGKRFPRRSTMKEHEKSFCRARVAFEENRKLKGDEQEESNSGEHSPVSVSPPPSSTQEAVSTHM